MGRDKFGQFGFVLQKKDMRVDQAGRFISRRRGVPADGRIHPDDFRFDSLSRCTGAVSSLARFRWLKARAIADRHAALAPHGLAVRGVGVPEQIVDALASPGVGKADRRDTARAAVMAVEDVRCQNPRKAPQPEGRLGTDGFRHERKIGAIGRPPQHIGPAHLCL